MNGPWEQTQRLCAGDVDPNAEWRMSGIFLAMQEVGSAQCDANRFGMAALREQNLAWVIYRARLSMERLPLLGETVTVRTWPKPPQHFFFPRYFEFLVDGATVGGASMLYAQLDLTSRRMVKPWLGDNTELACDLDPILPLPGAISKLDGQPEILGRVARYSDLDINGHVNNTRYLDWFCDAFPMKWHRTHRLRDVLIHYSREITQEESVRFSLWEQGERSVMRGSVEELPCFAVEGVWAAR